MSEILWSLFRVAVIATALVVIAFLITGCTVPEAASNLRALGERQVDHARTVLDEREFTYGRRLEIKRKECQAREDIADEIKFTCRDDDCFAKMADAYGNAVKCWEEAEPPLSDIVRYTEEAADVVRKIRNGGSAEQR